MKKSKTSKSKTSKSKILKRKNPPLAYDKINEALIKLNNEYVLLKNYNEVANIFTRRHVVNISDFTLIARGILIRDMRYVNCWIFQFNPLIQGTNNDLSLLSLESPNSEHIIQEYLFENFEQNYPPTHQFEILTDEVYDVIHNTIFLYNFKLKNSDIEEIP